jgi:hypothetical protein
LEREDIEELIEVYGFETLLQRFNLTPWKVLEILDDLGYILLEKVEDY